MSPSFARASTGDRRLRHIIFTSNFCLAHVLYIFSNIIDDCFRQFGSSPVGTSWNSGRICVSPMMCSWLKSLGWFYFAAHSALFRSIFYVIRWGPKKQVARTYT